MQYSVAYRVYHRPFCRPLQTHHGLWQVRSGIILRLTNEAGQARYGEIAPLEWFGTESLEAAIALCQSLYPRCSADDIQAIPAPLPACQFGFESALESFAPAPLSTPSTVNSVLLPTGIAALDAPIAPDVQTFKWKIGVTDLADELAWGDRLLQRLPKSSHLRLDANGGLTIDAARRWLEWSDRDLGRIEFLEQPLPVDQLEAMMQLSQEFETAIALDESVTTVAQLENCLAQGWRGVVVVKGAIAGSPHRLRRLSQECSLDLVWSSVFETAIAQHYVFERLIPSVCVRQPRALGFGVNQWFNDQWSHPGIDESLWQSLLPPVPS